MYRVLSYEFRVQTDIVEARARLGRLLSPFRSDGGGAVPTYVIRREARGRSSLVVDLDGRCVQRSTSLAPLIDFVLWDANTKATERATGFLVLHAGAVSWRGRGILLPAPPDSGKTTLSAGLTVSGFSYLTDEAALIEPGTGRLNPYPRALWLEDGSIPAVAALGCGPPVGGGAPSGRIRHVIADDLRPRSVGRACRVRWVVSPRYQPGSRTALESMSRAETVVLLAENAFNLARFGADGVRLLAWVVQDAGCYRLRMGDLGSAVAAISRLVRGG